ncbi:hypothetical protein D3C76_452210 [compost metagenome]
MESYLHDALNLWSFLMHGLIRDRQGKLTVRKLRSGVHEVNNGKDGQQNQSARNLRHPYQFS